MRRFATRPSAKNALQSRRINLAKRQRSTTSLIACVTPIARPDDRTGELSAFFGRGPHALDIARILQIFSRIRAELVGEFSLAIR
jgi:hypothetical protein